MWQRLRKQVSRRVKDERGFTLVELMMVMVSIGVLAGLGFTGYNVLEKRLAVTRADVYWRDLNAAVYMYQLEGGGFPTDIKELAGYLDLNDEPWISAKEMPADGPLDIGVTWFLVPEDPLSSIDRPDCVMVWVDGHPSTNNDPRCPFMASAP